MLRHTKNKYFQKSGLLTILRFSGRGEFNSIKNIRRHKRIDSFPRHRCVVAQLIEEYQRIHYFPRDFQRSLVRRILRVLQSVLNSGTYELPQIANQLSSGRRMKLPQQTSESDSNGGTVKRESGFFSHKSSEIGVIFQL